MAIAHDAQTRFPTTDTTGFDTTTGDRTFTHTPVGTPAGVVVVICCAGTTAPVSGVLYDGVAMTLRQSALDTSEAGSVWVYALTDVTIGSGAKTVTLQSCIAAQKFATCSTVTSATGLTSVNGENKKDTTTATNPTLNVTTTLTTLLYGGMHGGAADPTSYAVGSGYTVQYNGDYGALAARTQRRTSTVASGTIVYNFTYATSDDYCIAAVALAEKPVPKQTTVAEVSLGSHGTPSERTTHSIKIRARTTSGSTGVIKAALYEGANNRSGDLTSALLTTSLANYTLLISNAAAATITDYSNLTIKFWGYDDQGNALVFEVADVYLETPTASGPSTFYGVTSQASTFGAVVAAQRKTFSQVAAPFTFTKDVRGIRKFFSQVAAPFTFTKDVRGQRKTFGVTATPITFAKDVAGIIVPPKTTPVAEISLASHGTPSARTNHSIKIRARTTTGSTGVIKAALYEGATNRSGDLTSGALTNSLADYTLTIPDASAANITDYSNLTIKIWGYDSKGNALVFEVARVYLELPSSTTKSTPVARISLASHGTPSARTNHSIKIRARTTSGSTGVIKAALYEGATNRSGDLTSSGLTNSFADYTLAIPDASAANITDYSDLEIRIWGYDSTGNALVFEVARVYLELPVSTSTTYYGVVARPSTFGAVVSGVRKTFGVTATPITFTKDVSARRKTFGVTATSLIFAKDVSAQRKTFGVTATPITFAKDVSGRRKTFGQTALPITFAATTAGIRVPFTYLGQVALPITFSKDVSGRRKTFGQTNLPITFAATTAGIRVPFTYFGVVARPTTFGAVVSGQRKTFGVVARPIIFGSVTSGIRVPFTYFGIVARPITFSKDVAGQRKAFGQVALPITFGSTTVGRRTTFGQTALPILFSKDVLGVRKFYSALSMSTIFGKETAAQRKTFGVVARPITFGAVTSGIRVPFNLFGQVALPITFSKDVVGRRKTFGQTALPITFLSTTAGIRVPFTRFGITALPITFSKDVSGRRKTFGQTLLPLVFGENVVGQRKTFDQIVFPITFTKDVKGQKKTFGQSALPIIFFKDVAGQKKTFGQVALPLIFAKDVKGQRKTFGQTTLPLSFLISTAGIRLANNYFGQSALPIIFSKDVKGSRKTFGQLLSPYIFGKNVVGYRKTFGQTALPIIFSSTTRIGVTKYAILSPLPIIFGKDVSGGRRKTFSQTALPLVFGKDVSGRRKTFGRIDLPIIFSKEFIGHQDLFGRFSMTTFFGKETAGRRRTFSQSALPLIFTKDVRGYRKTFGVTALPIEVFISVEGISGSNVYGTTSFQIIFAKDVNGLRTTFGQVTAPFFIGSASQAYRETFSDVGFPIEILFDVEQGFVGVHSGITFPITVEIDSNGYINFVVTILNNAQNIYLGSTPVLGVYTKGQKVWSLT